MFFSGAQTILIGLACIAVGVACYRWMIRRDPEKLEAWAAEARARGTALKEAVTDEVAKAERWLHGDEESPPVVVVVRNPPSDVDAASSLRDSASSISASQPRRPGQL